MAHQIDFKQLLIELRPEDSRLTFLGTCMLTHYFFPLADNEELSAEQEQEMILDALFCYDDDLSTRQETLDDEEMKKKYPKQHESLKKVQEADRAEKLANIFSDCVQREKYMLLYAINLYLPLEDASPANQVNFENFLRSAELTEDEGREALLLIEQVCLEDNIEEPDFKAIKKAQKASSSKKEIKANFKDDQLSSDEVHNKPKNNNGYGLN